MIDEIQVALSSILEGKDLRGEQMRDAVLAIMDNRASEAAIAALLTALKIKGEAVDEIVGAVEAMRQRCTPIPIEQQGLLDTCGTGGDALHTFNISTATAIVAAAAGVPVAKHGNRSVSSSSGSADVLERLGVNIQLTVDQVARCVTEVGIGFCFAQLFHGAMKYAAPVRKELGFRTIFNLLGPLSNPASAEYQLVGANSPETADKLAHALAQLGTRSAVVVCGAGELDEVSLWGETTAFIVTGTNVTKQSWTAATLGLPECQVDDLKVSTPDESAAAIQSILDGETGPRRDMVLANVSAALLAANQTEDLRDGVSRAAEAIDSRRGMEVLRRLVEVSNSD